MADDLVGLARAVGALRRELTDAILAAQGDDLRFVLGPVEMEFLLDVRQESGGEAGVRFWVISLGAKGTRSSGSTHRVKLILTPKQTLEIADDE